MHRRRVLAAAPLLVVGCLGRECPGGTYRLTLSEAEIEQPSLSLGSAELDAEADAVVETAIDGGHVEHCVEWADPNRGTVSPGLYEIGERIDTAAGPLPHGGGTVTTGVERNGERYRLRLEVERGS